MLNTLYGFFLFLFRNLFIKYVDYAYSSEDEDSAQDGCSGEVVILQKDITEENNKYRIGDFNQSCCSRIFAFDSKDNQRASYEIGDYDQDCQS